MATFFCRTRKRCSLGYLRWPGLCCLDNLSLPFALARALWPASLAIIRGWSDGKTPSFFVLRSLTLQPRALCKRSYIRYLTSAATCLGWRRGLLLALYRLLITLHFHCFPKSLGHEVPAFTPTIINAALERKELDSRKRGRSCKKNVL